MNVFHLEGTAMNPTSSFTQIPTELLLFPLHQSNLSRGFLWSWATFCQSSRCLLWISHAPFFHPIRNFYLFIVTSAFMNQVFRHIKTYATSSNNSNFLTNFSFTVQYFRITYYIIFFLTFNLWITRNNTCSNNDFVKSHYIGRSNCFT